jgi:hypothetical protein
MGRIHSVGLCGQHRSNFVTMRKLAKALDTAPYGF